LKQMSRRLWNGTLMNKMAVFVWAIQADKW
jgi:hypothetical protein